MRKASWEKVPPELGPGILDKRKHLDPHAGEE